MDDRRINAIVEVHDTIPKAEDRSETSRGARWEQTSLLELDERIRAAAR